MHLGRGTCRALRVPRPLVRPKNVDCFHQQLLIRIQQRDEHGSLHRRKLNRMLDGVLVGGMMTTIHLWCRSDCRSRVRHKTSGNPHTSPLIMEPFSPRLSEDAKQLLRARRMATRRRAAAACKPCRSRKSKCSDFRPCARCKSSNPLMCVDSNDNKAGLLDENQISQALQILESLLDFHVSQNIEKGMFYSESI